MDRMDNPIENGGGTWTGTSQIRLSKWPANIWEGVWYHHSPWKCKTCNELKWKRLTTKYWQGCEACSTLIPSWWECKLAQLTLENFMTTSTKAEHIRSPCPSNPHIWACIQQESRHYAPKTHTSMFTTALLSAAPDWKNQMSLSWTDKGWYIHMLVYSTAMGKSRQQL